MTDHPQHGGANMDGWKHAREAQRKLKRAIKKLKLHPLTPGDGDAIAILKTAERAAKYGRTFDEQLVLRQTERARHKKKRHDTSHGAQPSSGLVRHSGRANTATA
jgi:hypothetical protein